VTRVEKSVDDLKGQPELLQRIDGRRGGLHIGLNQVQRRLTMGLLHDVVNEQLMRVLDAKCALQARLGGRDES